jgi:hypothetical protein
VPNSIEVTVLADAPVVAIVKITSVHILCPFVGWRLDARTGYKFRPPSAFPVAYVACTQLPLGRTLEFLKVPKREKAEVLAAFAAHKDEVTAGYVERPKARLMAVSV